MTKWIRVNRNYIQTYPYPMASIKVNKLFFLTVYFSKKKDVASCKILNIKNHSCSHSAVPHSTLNSWDSDLLWLKLTPEIHFDKCTVGAGIGWMYIFEWIWFDFKSCKYIIWRSKKRWWHILVCGYLTAILS